MKKSKSKIVSDGEKLLRDAKDYAAVKRSIALKIKDQYAVEAKSLSFWQRLRLRVKIRSEVRAELHKHFPPNALHFITK